MMKGIRLVLTRTHKASGERLPSTDFGGWHVVEIPLVFPEFCVWTTGTTPVEDPWWALRDTGDLFAIRQLIARQRFSVIQELPLYAPRLEAGELGRLTMTEYEDSGSSRLLGTQERTMTIPSGILRKCFPGHYEAAYGCPPQYFPGEFEFEAQADKDNAACVRFTGDTTGILGYIE